MIRAPAQSAEKNRHSGGSGCSSSKTTRRPATSYPGCSSDWAPRPLRILIAEDNEMLRYSVRELLRGFGHLVEAVANGREAVEAAARQAYDLVFLDIHMPELCGLETARTLRRISPGGGQARII